MKKKSVWLMLGGMLLAVGTLLAAETAMYGNTPSHNMVSDETGLPTKFDVNTGLNVLWSAELGSQSYAGPVVADGRVYVGTNNEREYNPKLTGDRGNVMAFDIKTGKLIWQSAHAKLPAGRVNDWPLQGVCSTPAIQDGVVYYTSNRAEIIAADAEGFTDGENDGPFTAETASGPMDEDIIWKLDMIGELDVFPHNLAAGSPLIVDGILYVITGQGVDEGHINIPSPLSPSFLAIDIKTGKVVWEGVEPSPHVLHGSWSNPSYGVIAGKPQVIFPGGDGWVYSYEPKTGKLIWKFDLNPKDSKWVLGGSGTRNNIISTAVIHSDRVYLGVGQDPEHGESGGHFYAIDGTMTGDVSDKATIWHVGGGDFHRTMSTAAIHDGLLYIADLSGFVYCLDLETGKQHWKYDAFAAIWGSTWVADGKVYIGDEDGDIAVLKAGTTMELLHETNMGAAVYTTPVARDGIMYVVSRNKIFALKKGIAPAGGASGSR
jgi:outer membrane protein assembly factor BamB